MGREKTPKKKWVIGLTTTSIDLLTTLLRQLFDQWREAKYQITYLNRIPAYGDIEPCLKWGLSGSEKLSFIQPDVVHAIAIPSDSS